jgi:glycosyltransferase involved in cell wall biosynthesis
MSKPNRPILFVLEHFHPYVGGVEQLFGQLTKALVRKGVRVTVLTTRHLASLPVEETIDGVRIRRIRTRNRYLFTLMALPVATWLAIQSRLVFTSTYNAALPAFLAASIARRRAYITVHEIWGPLWFRCPWLPKPSAMLHYLFERLVVSLPFRRFVAVSAFTRDALISIGTPSEKVRLIYNGLDYQKLARYLRKDPQEPSVPGARFIYYGRLGHSKGLDLIVEGGAQYLQRNPEAVIELIVPQVPRRFRKRLVHEIAKMQCSDRLILTPSLPEEMLFRRLQEATAVMIPSRSEGFCFVAAECAALGVPVVSSGMGALTETASGRVITLNSLSPEALCEALEKAAAGSFSECPINRFPLEDQVQLYLQLLEE